MKIAKMKVVSIVELEQETIETISMYITRIINDYNSLVDYTQKLEETILSGGNEVIEKINELKEVIK